MSFLQLVADPQRWQLLSHLGESDRRVGELASLTGQAQNLVSYHLRELRSAGLVTSRRSSADGRDTYYRLDVARCAAGFSEVAASLHPGARLVPAGTAAPVTRRKHRVLFLCTGNSARSQMAEALLQSALGDRVDAASAGSHPKAVHPLAVRVLAERGVDISARRAKALERFASRRFDRVVTLCDKVREVCPEFPGQPRYVHWSMPDPSVEGTYAAFVAAADEIETRVTQLVAQLREEPAHARR